MTKLMSAFLVFSALVSPIAFANGGSCAGSNSIETLPDCDAAHIGLACGLGDEDSFAIYVCRADGWHLAETRKTVQTGISVSR